MSLSLLMLLRNLDSLTIAWKRDNPAKQRQAGLAETNNEIVHDLDLHFEGQTCGIGVFMLYTILAFLCFHAFVQKHWQQITAA